MSTDLPALDWHNAPSATWAVGRLQRLFRFLNDCGSAGLRLSLSSNPKTAFSVVMRNDHPTVMRRDNPV